jgi:NADH-quinone oxidoreductase subunit K
MDLLMPIGPSHYLVLSALLFIVGTAGVLSRRNLFVVLMSLELMLNAVNLTFVTFSRVNGEMTGQVVALFVVAVAAAEACVGLAIVVALFRLKETVDLDMFKSLKG